jgi:GNAT superfamily N-acetyltransferase
MNAEYRRATLFDAGHIAETHCASWRTTYPGLLPESEIAARTDLVTRVNAWTEILGKHQSRVWMAYNDEIPCIGFCCFGPALSTNQNIEGQVSSIYLLKSAQGLGIGRELIRRALNEMREWGYRAAFVEVLKGNSAEIFYERVGARFSHTEDFVICGETFSEHIYIWDDLQRTLANYLKTAPQV